MKKFKNTKTGNIVRAKSEAAIKLMEKSEQYTAVAAKKPKDKGDEAAATN